MKYQKILLFNPFGIGDVLFTLPMLNCLRKAYPQAHITYCCNQRVFPLLCSQPYIDEVYVFEKDAWRKLFRESKAKFLKRSRHDFFVLKNSHFDIVFDFSLNALYGFILSLAGITLRIGYDYHHRGRFLTHKIAITEYRNKHVSLYHKDLLQYLGIRSSEVTSRLYIPQQQKSAVEGVLKSYGIERSKKIIAVIGGSGDSWGEAAYYKRWPEENFARLIDKLNTYYDCQVLLLGSPGEKEISQSIKKRMQTEVFDFTGEFSLLEFCALLSLCVLVVSNDGGPFHIGQALGIKVIGIFGPVDERVYGGFPSSSAKVIVSKVTCRPCYRNFKFTGCPYDKKCLREITVDSVFNEAKILLKK